MPRTGVSVIETVPDMRAATASSRCTGGTVGLVPTMGALHAGHWALVERCRRECDATVVSIFVNPLQFAPGEDLDRYPRTQSADLAGCGERGVDHVFIPSIDEMYADGASTRIHVAGMSDVLCGRTRPGHFDGVCTVVCKLLNVVAPDVAYFGEKDYQQLVIIRRMVRDLSLHVEVRGCPVVRESDGLACSSRNAYLSSDERARAPRIHQALRAAADRVRAGQCDASALVAQVEQALRACVDRIDYVAVVDAETLASLARVDRPARLCAAAFLGQTRLIDNLALDAGVAGG